MSESLVKVENVSKKFCRSLKRSLWYGMQDIGVELMGRSNQNGKHPLRPDEFWAVQDVSFELKRGDCLGLVGRNGAGKSTLLKMLNGLIKPDSGRIEMHGRIGALIELGTGFNPILTGRENVYVNGSVLGFSKKEIDRKFEAILDFAEIGDFIDMPVKNYSSGMKVRLGFAVAAQMDPDVLLIDEVLAVGDIGFKIKCYNEIYQIMQRAAVIFVSHSMPQVAKVCNRGILMNSGLVKCASANVATVIDEYYNEFSFGIAQLSGNQKAVIRAISITHAELDDFIAIPNEQVVVDLEYGNPLNLKLLVDVDASVTKFNIIYSFTDVEQKLVAQCFSHTSVPGFVNNGQGTMHIGTRIDPFSLGKGKYTLGVTIREINDNENFTAVLANYMQLLEMRVKYDEILGAAPVQFAAPWTINYV